MIDKYRLEELRRDSGEKGELARWVIQLQKDLDDERRKTTALESCKAAPQVTSVPEIAARLVDAYLMNEGKDSEFIACYTISKHDRISEKGKQIWEDWRALSAALKSSPAVQAEQLSGNTEQVSQPYTLRDAVTAIRNSGIAIDAGNIQAERDALNEPTCWCRTCRPITVTDMRFVVCPECGNKRCPHANDHRNACTGSNEPGQEGSAYPDAPKQEAE